MLVIGRRLMKNRLAENFAAAKADETAAREAEKNAGEQLMAAKGPREVTVAQKVLAKAKESLAKASRVVQNYAPKKQEHNNDQERARTSDRTNLRQRKSRVLEFAELGDKVCPFTEYGKNYNGSQLGALYRHVGQSGLGLPAFGPNILRTIHVTAVMNVCYQLGINQADDRVLNHFALGRHGEYEMRKAYNLAKSDNSNDDPNSFSAQISGITGTLAFNRECMSAEEVARMQNSALEKWIPKSLSCRGGISMPESMGQEPVEVMMAMLRGLFSKQQVVDDDEGMMALRKQEEKERLEASILESAVRKRRAEQELHSLGGAAVLSGPRKETGSGPVSGVKRSGGNADKAKPPKKRANRGTFTLSDIPLLLEMNSLFLREMKKMGFDKREKGLKLKRGSRKHSMANCKTFAGMMTEGVKECMMENIVEKEEDGCEVVRRFYELFSDREERIRAIVKKANKQAGSQCRWSHWFCFTCEKVQCACNQEE